ncbi:hypothetical protein PSTT_10603 [Puccinia striiformis]|uniref:HTH CENPB-type domain-containing protein n=1 Tax=Puccinia striiformis TaxID=27350 RepID=A0A2S4V3R2_9BASI|nr:hypothetical protein PSTT_10603 [Puccinia striiformis]
MRTSDKRLQIEIHKFSNLFNINLKLSNGWLHKL